jgi:hypothetical protein
VVLVEVVGDGMQASDAEHGSRADGKEENDQRDEMFRDEKGGVRSVRGWRRGKGPNAFTLPVRSFDVRHPR